MILQPRARARSSAVRRRINRAPSPVLAVGLPWLSVMLGSIAATILVIASAPIMPPLGFLTYLAWRQLRPGLLPIWAGLPLGLVDDLYSGQPFGSAVLLWSIAAIVLDILEARVPWRDFLTEWLVAAAMTTTYVIACLAIANIADASTPLLAIVPQIIASILVYPLVCRMVAMIDRARLVPVVELNK
ncbi:MAG: rod shape-determining protein MreD [Novosphingobium sp.]|nr:rod shape-determining protein MreD [Novosphingobium sp.]